MADAPHLFDVFGLSMELAAAAHGTAPASEHCEACKALNHQLGEWYAAHEPVVSRPGGGA